MISADNLTMYLRLLNRRRRSRIGVGTAALLQASEAERDFERRVARMLRRQWRLVVARHRKWTRLQAGRHRALAGREFRRVVFSIGRRPCERRPSSRRTARAPADPAPAQVTDSHSVCSRPSCAHGGFFISKNEIARATTPAISQRRLSRGDNTTRTRRFTYGAA